mmetsp:Transcript_19325/g.32317  ORF Transcript_19325/g.32317 Transcript_19325/m.32317 type:complete len:210 (+) Transcript_19325:873-1502(+)
MCKVPLDHLASTSHHYRPLRITHGHRARAVNMHRGVLGQSMRTSILQSTRPRVTADHSYLTQPSVLSICMARVHIGNTSSNNDGSRPPLQAQCRKLKLAHDSIKRMRVYLQLCKLGVTLIQRMRIRTSLKSRAGRVHGALLQHYALPLLYWKESNQWTPIRDTHRDIACLGKQTSARVLLPSLDLSAIVHDSSDDNQSNSFIPSGGRYR